MSEKKEGAQNPMVEGLEKRRTVVLGGKITHESVVKLSQRLITLQMQSSEPINLIIDSGGGSIDAALGLCDLITSILIAPVRGIALGACGSAATFVILHCNERLASPYSRFLIHSGTRSEISIPINQTTSENLEQLLKDVKATEEMVLTLYMNHLTPIAWAKKKPSIPQQRKYVQNLIERGDQRFDCWLSAEEAVEVGLVTEIIQGKLDIFSD